jgi:hypothetical protein
MCGSSGIGASADPCGHEAWVTGAADVTSSYGEYVQFLEVSPDIQENP